MADSSTPSSSTAESLANTVAQPAALRQRRGGPAPFSTEAFEEMTKSSRLLEYIAPSALAMEMRDVASQPTIVDVRSAAERTDGYIANSLHVPYVDGLLPANAKQLLEGRTDIVFHCMYSKERAPRAAQDFASQINTAARVRILTGGFQQLLSHLYPDKALLKDNEQGLHLLVDVNPSQWISNGRQGLVWRPDMGFEHLSENELTLRAAAGIPVPVVDRTGPP